MLQPTTRAAILEPRISSPHASDTQGQLWNEAYGGLKLESPDLVEKYEKLQRRELGRSNSSSGNLAASDSAIEKTDIERSQAQMDGLLKAALTEIDTEAAAKQKIQGGVDVVTTFTAMIKEAVEVVPQAAVAWAPFCLLLQVSFPGKRVGYQ